MRRRGEPAAVLSPREVEVLRLASEGRTNAAIGRALRISPTTVKTHLMRVYDKLGVGDRTSAVNQAIRRGLLPED
ncbi:helix-turn-helix transcriptional regulator [Nocardiopsis dassonvillei]|nr:helix-turn-helix transcriptional regulator [Nocardiopsis dassonvillei]